MLEIDFAGWFECRLATDPDAYDDLRGQFGWTFAMPGEPDLDRVIRFQNPVAPRSRCPAVEVFVTGVCVDGSPSNQHVLLGAAVELLDGAVFDGRNGEIATAAQEPIVPFAVCLRGGGATLLGRDPIDLSNPDDVARRQPNDFVGNSPEVAQATGVANRVAYRQQRRALLQQDLAGEIDPTRQAALQKRIDELNKGSIRVTSLGFQLTYEFDLRGPNDWNDPDGELGAAPATGAGWRVRFWMGGWDADALEGYVKGTLRVG
jgi:hypothetical protein